MASFIVLRVRFPKIDRPYLSPLGIAGAAIAAAIAGVTLITLFLNPDYNRSVSGAALWFVAGIAYFAVYARRRLILAPEEEFAILHRKP
jgi:ethanolamine permease